MFYKPGDDAVVNRPTRKEDHMKKISAILAILALLAIFAGCSKAPEGRTHWTLKLLADELKKRRLVTHVCVETVRKALKKMNCSPGASSVGVFRKKTQRVS